MEFSSLKAFVKFVLHIQLELQSYPERVAFTVSPIIGHLGFVTDVVICNYCILVKHRKAMSMLLIVSW